MLFVMGVARIFQRGGHTLSNRVYSRFRNLNIVGCLSKKRLTKGASRAPQDPTLATPLFVSINFSLEKDSVVFSAFVNYNIMLCIEFSSFRLKCDMAEFF